MGQEHLCFEMQFWSVPPPPMKIAKGLHLVQNKCGFRRKGSLMRESPPLQGLLGCSLLLAALSYSRKKVGKTGSSCRDEVCSLDGNTSEAHLVSFGDKSSRWGGWSQPAAPGGAIVCFLFYFVLSAGKVRLGAVNEPARTR